MAQAAGLTLVPRARRDPGRATTFGVGTLVANAVARGCRLIAVTLGGSATVDGGAGMAQALGAHLTDRDGRPVPPGGAGLLKLAAIDARPIIRLMKGVHVVGLTDVRNPLLGRLGAARVFGPQKGATPSQVRMLERGLARFAAVCRRDLGKDVTRIPGAGAAGGLGAGLAAFLGAKLESGADWIFRRLDLDSHLERADLVLTGEGSLDEQTRMGKLVARVAARARRSRVPVIAFAGRVKLSKRQIGKIGLKAAYGLAGKGVSTAESFRRTAILLERRAFEALRRL
jgi:glycerate kinase